MAGSGKRHRFDGKFQDSGRLNYLRELKNEFESTKSLDAKRQTVANLANFAYNCENYGHLYNLAVHELFSNNMDSTDIFIALSSLKGICNLASFPPCAAFLCQSNIIHRAINCMKSRSDSIDFITNALLLLFTLKQTNLIAIDSQAELRIKQIIEGLPEALKCDARVKNLYQILQNDS